METFVRRRQGAARETDKGLGPGQGEALGLVLKTIYTLHMRIFVDDLDLSNQFAAAAAAHATKGGSSITAATTVNRQAKTPSWLPC